MSFLSGVLLLGIYPYMELFYISSAALAGLDSFHTDDLNGVSTRPMASPHITV